MHKKRCFIVTDTFLYKNGYVKPIEQKLDEMELLQVEKHTAEEIEEMIRREEFPQTDHILAWYLWKNK